MFVLTVNSHQSPSVTGICIHFTAQTIYRQRSRVKIAIIFNRNHFPVYSSQFLYLFPSYQKISTLDWALFRIGSCPLLKGKNSYKLQGARHVVDGQLLQALHYELSLFTPGFHVDMSFHLQLFLLYCWFILLFTPATSFQLDGQPSIEQMYCN